MSADKQKQRNCSLQKAVAAHRFGVAAEWIEHGADPNAQNFSKQTALHHAVSMERMVSGLVSLLVENGADPHHADRSGRTPRRCGARALRAYPAVVRRCFSAAERERASRQFGTLMVIPVRRDC